MKDGASPHPAQKTARYQNPRLARARRGFVVCLIQSYSQHDGHDVPLSQSAQQGSP